MEISQKKENEKKSKLPFELEEVILKVRIENAEKYKEGLRKVRTLASELEDAIAELQRLGIYAVGKEK